METRPSDRDQRLQLELDNFNNIVVEEGDPNKDSVSDLDRLSDVDIRDLNNFRVTGNTRKDTGSTQKNLLDTANKSVVSLNQSNMDKAGTRSNDGFSPPTSP